MPDSNSTNPPASGQGGTHLGPGEAATEAAPQAPREPQKQKRVRRFRRSGIAILVAAVLIGLLQATAFETDYQYAFLFSTLIAFFTAVYVLYQVHRVAYAAQRRWLVPVSTVLVVMLFPALLRFKHFSGEMVPRFEWRFASRKAPPLVAKISSDEQSGDEVNPDKTLSSDESAPTKNEPSSAESRGFLGNRRTGVIPQRMFSIPESREEVEKLWSIGVGEGWGSFAVADENAVTLEQRDDRECVTCYRLSDGALRWIRRTEARHEHPFGGIGPRSTPTIDDGLVYAQGAVGDVWCIELASGDVRWKSDLLELGGWGENPAQAQERAEEAAPWGRSGSPLLVGGLCVVPFGASDFPKVGAEDGRSLIAFDAKSGEVEWTAGDDQISYASPQVMTLAGVKQIVSVNESTITGHEIGTGDTLWSYPWPGQTNAAASCSSVMPVSDSRFLIGKGYGGGSALVEVTEVSEGEFKTDTLWDTLRLLKTKFTHALVDGHVAYGLSDGTLEAINIEEQEQLWKQSRSSRYGQGQALLVEDVLVVQAESGDVAFVAADPLEYRELFRLDALSSKTWNVPTVAGTYLLVRNDREAICYRLPARMTPIPPGEAGL